MKKFLLLFAAILMASAGLWAETVNYLYPVYNTDGVPTSGIKEWKTASVDATVVEDAATPVTWGTAGTETWYVVKGSDVTLSKGAICSGDVHLILADGAKLTATGIDDSTNSTPGIQVSGDGNSLTIYGQTAQTGILKATGFTYSAGIGGISTNGLQDGSNITINGGTITADGGSQAAAIGGGLRGNGSNITINGGTVTAKGSAAGIGGGLRGNGSNITINGGTMIHAKAGNGSAGIGGGENGNGSNITINSGTVWAEGSRGGAGIGGGYARQEYFEGGQGSSITINGGNVTAEGEDGSDGIGNGANATTPSSDIFVATWCIVKAGSSSNSTTEITTDRTSTTDIATDLAGKQYVTVEPMKVAVTYGDNITVSPAFASGAEIEVGTQITFTAADRTANNYGFIGFYKESTFDTPITTGVNGSTYTVMVTDAPISVYARYGLLVSYVYPVYNDPDDVTEGVKEWKTGTVNAIEVTSSTEPVTLGERWTTTWYVVTGKDVTLSQGAICTGNVNLILADGAKLTATGADYQAGITTVTDLGNSLTIYGQTAQSGQLEANGGTYAAGIGGGYKVSASNITINGGKVTARGKDGAGIGGGFKGSGSIITINGGAVTANGGTSAAGIGGGCLADGLIITINGGTVRAYGGGNAAGIGGGLEGKGLDITIKGGMVMAYGGGNASGIGKGRNGIVVTFITVATTHIVKAGSTENPTDVIANTGGDLAESLEGKQYVTITEPYFNITANQDPNNKANYYSTFYSRTCDYQVPSGVTAYTGAVDGDVLKLTAIESGIIPTGEAVILRLTTEDNTATKKQFDLTALTTTATKSTDNKLSGTDVAKTLGANEYALSLGQNGVGFYLWEDKSIGAHKAYLTLPSAQLAPGRSFGMIFDDGTVTGIPATIIDQPQDDIIYNLQGQRVDESYKGLIIKNGQKVYNY